MFENLTIEEYTVAVLAISSPLWVGYLYVSFMHSSIKQRSRKLFWMTLLLWLFIFFPYPYVGEVPVPKTPRIIRPRKAV